MNSNEYMAKPSENINIAIERAVIMARALKTQVFITLNGARFCVSPDTTIQHAINTYLEIKDKMFKTEQLLKQKTRQ